MMIPGEIAKQGAYYAALLEPLGAYGQGRTRAAARGALAAAILDYAADHAPLDGFAVDVTDDGEATLYVTSNDPVRLTALLLRRQRELREMSLADVAAASNAKSRNGWAQYEQGRCEPSVTKLEEMLAIIAPELAVAIIPRSARVLPRWDDEGAGDANAIERLLESSTPVHAARRGRAKRRVRGASGASRPGRRKRAA